MASCRLHLHGLITFFFQIKLDLEKLEQTKDEEAKKLANHKITFEFSILVRIKELMVDVSSNCMELALKVYIYIHTCMHTYIS